eukprot:CAMPEP_0196994598 /NCGR_PEP_ID=MMETSP1380-20130617/873_1 /TAXON_ID=5936 /ORGANISM="Euplotes crassus, Strain CT5" /LENGTH=203 /DNA_ID=CAMNT_0042410017 /DNA_START=57 /DNA_END=668 /DNA_ORIENTATION=-
MKHSIENRQGKQWSLNDDQTLWLRNQITNQIKASLFSKNNKTPGKVVLSCSIKFTPDKANSLPQVAEKVVKVEGSQKRRKEVIGSKFKESEASKVLHMKCMNLSFMDCETDDPSNVCLADLKTVKQILSSNIRPNSSSKSKNEGTPKKTLKKRDQKRQNKDIIEWPEELREDKFSSERKSFEQMLQAQNYNAVVDQWLCSKPV